MQEHSPAQAEWNDTAMAALALFGQRRYGEAEQLARGLTASFPQLGFGWKALGLSLSRQGQLASALPAMRRSVQLLPGDPEAHLNLGVALTQAGLSDEAEAALCHALALAPESHAVHGGCAVLCQQRGRLPEAIAHLRQALTLRLRQPSQAVAVTVRPSFHTPEHEALLWQTLAQLAAAGVHAFATAGTLLGLQRDGRLLAFDKDLDVGLSYAERGVAGTCLLAHGWVEAPLRNGVSNPKPYIHKGTGLVLDLCFYVVEADTGKTLGGFWMDNIPAHWNRISEFPPLTLSSRQHQAGMVWALAEPSLWLTAMYGDWRTPDPDFDTTIAAHNLRGFSLLTQFFAFFRIYERWQSGALTRALANTGHSLRHLPDDDLLRQVSAHLAAALEAC